MSTTAHERVVLVGLDAHADHFAALQQVADEVGALAACLHGVGPSLVGVLDQLAQTVSPTTVVRLIVVAQDESHTGRSWVVRVAGHWTRTRGSLVLEVSAKIVREIAAAPVRQARAAGFRRVTGAEAGLENPGWQDPPPYRHHVLVCRGPRCNAKGAEEAAAALTAELGRRDLLDSHVLVAQTGCLFPCNRAPVIVSHPDDTWFSHVTATEAARIVAEHLAPPQEAD